MSALIVATSLLAIIVYLIYVLASKKFSYWEKKNVPHVKPLPIVGNYAKYILLQEYVGKLVQRLCQQFPNTPYFGAYYGTEPVLVVQSPELLKHIFTKDFYYVHGREVSKYCSKEIITQNLFFSGGDNWKIVRQNLTPLFTSAKMKNMFYLIENCSHVLEDTLIRDTKLNDVVEARDLSTRFTMDCICSCAFGVESNVMAAPENNPFAFMAEEIFRASKYRGFLLIFKAIWPAIFYGIGLQCFPSSIDTFFSRLLKGVFESRDYKPSNRNDFVDLVLNLKKEEVISSDSLKSAKTGITETVQLKVDDDLLVAQCVVFFAAGFETSATTLSFTLFELAKKPEAQKRAAEEVDEFLRRHNNKLSYECINELPYLEACVYETIRLYPVLGNLTREVMDDYTLPTGLHLEKGVRVHIPVYHLHHNPDYFPDPETYKPERFLPENKDDIKPFTFLPYGEGPRICIGKRFSKMQVLAGLVTFLKTYRVELAQGMPENVEFDCRTILIQPKDQGLFLKAYKREGWEQRMFVRS
ncbi:cytochrome P450 6B5-like [Anticarsia gemmatalis]|uniref:cytochrome P450 6B5-like n=1 Tax=Anticarsia gemmatalis TaxID=129554 RepID=UPI003F765283